MDNASDGSQNFLCGRQSLLELFPPGCHQTTGIAILDCIWSQQVGRATQGRQSLTVDRGVVEQYLQVVRF